MITIGTSILLMMLVLIGAPLPVILLVAAPLLGLALILEW